MKTEEARNCSTCSNMVFDRLWGEYKCLEFQHRIYNPEEYEDCTAWVKCSKKKKRKESTCYDDE